MSTLKEHKDAMVDLLANGSAIPASASRLAHAMHDVLEILLADKSSLQDRLFVAQVSEQAQNKVYGALSDAFKASLQDATTPGLNEKALSKPVTATKTDNHATRPAPAEVRVKELQNTIRQLRDSNAKLREQHASCFKALEDATVDCQNLQHRLDCAENEVMCLRVVVEADPKEAIGYILRANSAMTGSLRRAYLEQALKALNYEPEQAGVRKEDTEIDTAALDEAHAKHHGNQCEHDWVRGGDSYLTVCSRCGAIS